MRRTLAASIILAGLVIPALVSAEEPKGPGKVPGANFPSPEQIKQQLIAKFDANRDGRLSEQEQLQAQEFMRRQGVVLPGGGFGGGVAGPGAFPNPAEILKRFDANGDGQLSEQEKMTAQAAFQRMRGQGGGANSGPQVGPGGFPGPEGNAGPLAGGSEGKPVDKRSALVKRFDKDGDGKLSVEEKADAQAELKKSKTKTKSKEKPAK